MGGARVEKFAGLVDFLAGVDRGGRGHLFDVGCALAVVLAQLLVLGQNHLGQLMEGAHLGLYLLPFVLQVHVFVLDGRYQRHDVLVRYFEVEVVLLGALDLSRPCCAI